MIVRKDTLEHKPGSIIKGKEIPEEVRNYLKRINSEELIKEGLTEKQVEKLKDVIRMMNLGPGANIIQTCSENCPSIKRCPLAIIKKAPVGKLCPIEMDLYSKYSKEYKEVVLETIKGFNSIKDIEENPIIASMISDLVQLEILQLRSDAMIAEAGMVEMVPAIAHEGGVEYRTEEHIAVKLKDRIGARKDKVLKQLMATPEMHQRIRSTNNEDTKLEKRMKTLEKARMLAQEIVIEPDKEE